MSMNFNKATCLILGCVLLFACSQEKNRLEPKRTVIAGVVTNYSGEVVLINYCNNLSDERRYAPNLTETNGYFKTEHEYLFAQNLTIRFANRFINVFVHPGDSIFVSIDANEVRDNYNNAITFSGDNPELNKELFIWHAYSSNIFNQDIPHFENNASPKELLASIKREFDKAHDSIKAYSERINMSDFLRKWAYVDRKFTIANLLLDYYIENKNKENMWDIFTNPIFDVFDEDNFLTMYFQYHLSVCMNALPQNEDEISRLVSEKKYVSVIQSRIEKLLEKAPKGVVRDVMLFGFLKGVINEMPELYDSISAIKTVFTQDYFNTELKKLSEKNKTIEQAAKLSEAERLLDGILYLTNDKMEELPNIRLLDFLSTKYEGKVLYLDVWATWCGPCIEEFKSTPGLHEHFKDKDVVFVNLCLSSNIDSWRPIILKNSVGGEHYFLGDNASKIFMGENNLEGFPSYMILDKNRAIHYPVPRPSNLESAIKKIESCL